MKVESLTSHKACQFDPLTQATPNTKKVKDPQRISKMGIFTAVDVNAPADSGCGSEIFV